MTGKIIFQSFEHLEKYPLRFCSRYGNCYARSCTAIEDKNRFIINETEEIEAFEHCDVMKGTFTAAGIDNLDDIFKASKDSVDDSHYVHIGIRRFQ